MAHVALKCPKLSVLCVEIVGWISAIPINLVWLFGLDFDVTAKRLRHLADVEPTKAKVAIVVTPNPCAMLAKAADDQGFK